MSIVLSLAAAGFGKTVEKDDNSHGGVPFVMFIVNVFGPRVVCWPV